MVALLTLLAVLGGCLGATSSALSQECNINSLGFYKPPPEDLSRDEYYGWGADKLRVGYELGSGADILLVAYEDDTVLGVKHVTSNRAVASDGEILNLDQPLKGSHTVRVLAYGDTNGDSQFDPETDTRCSVQTNPLTLNFSQLNTTTISD
nr:hypothetical protein [Haloferax larsenii]